MENPNELEFTETLENESTEFEGAEGTEDSDLFTDEAEGGSESDESGEPAEGSKTKGTPDESGKKAPLFDDTQQKAVDRIVQTRLDRQEEKIYKDLTSYAGVNLEKAEVADAARLWGILKNNPNLSAHIEQIIGNYAQQFPDAIPQSQASGHNDAELKSALLDKRANDPVFNKYHKDVLNWADENGYDIRDEKTLDLVYKTWKLEKTSSRTSQKPTTKGGQAPPVKGKTTPSISKGSGIGMNNGKQADPKTLSDRDLLASKGLSLFTED